jgi:hypothetical protein
MNSDYRTDHLLIGELLMRTAEALDLVRIIERLDELAPALREHTSREEGPGGAVEWLVQQRGEAHAIGRRLLHEHRGFSQMVRLLRDEAQGLLTDDLAGERRGTDLACVRRQVAGFIELVRAHERAETEALARFSEVAPSGPR